ncbi:MAG: hypothetical protein M3065_10485 [Actinomycetota bacterium]|nr:hypothetical protein [Actinomycetota bacterium]
MSNEAREWDLVRRSLEAISVDPRDLGRFVNRPHPGVIEPSSFDSAAATPVLLEWLPKVTDRALKNAIIGRLRNPAAKGIATEPLIREFKTADDEMLRWHAGDALQFSELTDHPNQPSLKPRNGI